MLLLVFPFASKADEWEKPNFDYKNYELSGKFRYKDNYMNFDFPLIQNFYIYNNRIYIDDNIDVESYMAYPDGSYELETDKGSKIKLYVKNGIIEDFYINGSEEKFIKNEKKVEENDYCPKGLFLILDEVLYKRDNIKRIKINILKNGESDDGFYAFKYGDKTIILYFYGVEDIASIIPGYNEFVLLENNNIFKKELEYTDYDTVLKIKDCVLVDYDKNKIELVE